jgi:hypothetical protein
MAKIRFQFEVAKDALNGQTAQLIEQNLSNLDSVERVKAKPEAPRFTGLEVVAIISTTVLTVERSDDLVEHLRKLIQHLKGLVQDIKGLQEVFVEVGEKRVPLSEVQEETLHQLARITKP